MPLKILLTYPDRKPVSKWRELPLRTLVVLEYSGDTFIGLTMKDHILWGRISKDAGHTT